MNGYVYLGYQSGYGNWEDTRLFTGTGYSNTLIYGGFDNGLVQINGDLTTTYSGIVTSTIESADNGAVLKIKIIGSNSGQLKFYDNGSFGASTGYSNSDNHLFFYQGAHSVFIENGSILPAGHKT